jgi:hypothetical protein
MTSHSLVLIFVIGGAVLAGWIDHRWAGRVPGSARPVLVHVVVGLLALVFAPTLMALFAPQESPARAMAALFALFLPAVVYCFLGWIWMVRLVQRLQRFG